MTQNDTILSMLREAGTAGVTPLDALEGAGCFRLAARVADLKARGHTIENVGKHHARYVLRDPEPAGTFVQTSWTDA